MNRFSNILYIADADANDADAFEQAANLASANQAKLTIAGFLHDLDTVKTDVPIGQEIVETMISLRREKLQALAKSASDQGTKIEIRIFSGKASVDIVGDVLKFDRDLLIKPLQPKEHIRDILFGGTDMKLLRKCPCPVWLIKSTEQQHGKDILVCVDYEPGNTENDLLNSHIIELASSLALSESCQLHIAHAWRLRYESFLRSGRSNLSAAEVDSMVKEEEQNRKAWLSGLVETCLGEQGKDITNYLKPLFHLLEGDPVKVAPELTESLGIELVVMGTVGRTGIPGYLMGNTAETILNQIDCSVLAIKPRAFKSPISI